jgi:hypothetical protein
MASTWCISPALWRQRLGPSCTPTSDRLARDGKAVEMAVSVDHRIADMPAASEAGTFAATSAHAGLLADLEERHYFESSRTSR